MTPKEYKNKIRHLEQRRESLADRIAKLKKSRTFLTGISYDGIHVQTSPNGSNQSLELTERITDLEKQFKATAIELDELRGRFESVILSINDYLQSDVLYQHWLNGVNLFDYSITNNYDYTYIRQIHGKAIRSFIEKDSKMN